MTTDRPDDLPPEPRVEEAEEIMRFSRGALVGTFAGFTVVGTVVGFWAFPEDWGALWQSLAGAALGFWSALILFANRYIAS